MKTETKLTHAGRPEPIPEMGLRTVNQPVYHCSTLLYDTFDQLEEWKEKRVESGAIGYGIGGTDLTRAYENLLADLEDGAGAIATGSGLAAITLPLTAYTKAGDHVLMVDTCYGPTRKFCDNVLVNYNIEIEYYDPLIGADIEKLIRPNTSVIFMEAPGSVTFEMQDVPAICKVAQKHGCITMLDNTWATPLFFKPLKHGVDISIHAATKYIGGHSDFMGGITICNEKTHLHVREVSSYLGHHAAPDDLFLALRGLRSLEVRLKRHEENAMIMAKWLKEQQAVQTVLYPALPEDAGYEIWKRDFEGASALMSIILQPNIGIEAVKTFVEELKYFGMGYSWGGYESLIVPHDPRVQRSATPWPRAENQNGILLRLHFGLENPIDLQQDLGDGFAKMLAT
ncbi:MAG: cystathionine beta-lyase [Alphaproteobacteria bacterium]